MIKKASSKDGTNIAYTVHGKGPPLVKTASYITHLVHDWDNLVWRPLLQGLCRFNTLIRYDERGTGLSDWYTGDYSWESWVEDLKAVVDAENIDRFILFGQSQGSTVATAFAAKYPERVEKLIIFGGYARGWLHRDLTDEEKKEEELLVDMIRIGWGKENPAFRKFFCSQLMPSASMARINSLNDLVKKSADPEIAAILEKEMHLSNVEKDAINVVCPSLIFHSYRDASIPFNEGKLLADLIPNSKFVRLDSDNHILQDNEPAWFNFWDELYRFIDITEDYDHFININEERTKRVLKTIVFTDIVESTRIALELGDQQWIRLLERLHEITEEILEVHEGEIIKDTGDGYLILFESPSNAIAYSKELIRKMNNISVSIRCGIHAGEVERISEDIRGINVHIASRILSEAEPNEILVSNVITDLSYGSSIKFKSHGYFNLKGIADKKELFQILE